MSLLKGLIDCCSTKGPLMKHNVPVWMSTAHQCYYFLTYPSLPSSPLFPPVMLSGSRAFPECHHNTLHLHLHSPLHPQRRSAFSLFPASLLSLPRSHHSCSQAPSLAATVSPPPPSELHCECLVQQPQPLLQYAALPCLFTVQPEPNAAHTASPFGLRGGEGKALQTADPARKTRQRHWLLSSSTQAVWIWMFADIYRFVSSQLKYTYPLCLFLCLVCRLTLAPWFRFR